MTRKVALIVGGGPAGLTAAYELLERSDIKPVVLEATRELGGLARTVDYKGNRIDIGGHRFFSKSSRVMRWWKERLPVQTAPAWDDLALGRQLPPQVNPQAPPADPERTDRVLLVRGRLSRIYFLRRFFDYPIRLTWNTMTNLGSWRLIRIAMSYTSARLRPIRAELSLEDFFINRFGRELYRIFFRDYTEKVWGVPCRSIKPEWGAQRIKGLSITRALWHAARKAFIRDPSIAQKNTETSLIDRFLYPKFGPGQMWEETARLVVDRGGEVCLGQKVVAISLSGSLVNAITVEDQANGEERTMACDFLISSMPLRELVEALGNAVPADAAEVGRGLIYRDFITVGLLVKRLKIHNETAFKTVGNIIPDNWIYIQEPEVRLGRLQIFNNWSPYLVKDPDTVWVGLEYFCNEGDDLWNMEDAAFALFAIGELATIGIIEEHDVLDSTVLRAPKAYPAYFGSYDRFGVLREYLDTIGNLFVVGRNGMHKYNNQDHSMLTAMTAVDNIVAGVKGKDNIWQVNTEQDYHEKQGCEDSAVPGSTGVYDRQEITRSAVAPDQATGGLVS